MPLRCPRSSPMPTIILVHRRRPRFIFPRYRNNPALGEILLRRINILKEGVREMYRALRCSVVLMALLILAEVAAGASLPVTPMLNIPAAPALLRITNAALSNLVAMGEVEGQVFGAARNQLVALDQEGKITKSVAIPIEQPAGISAYTAGWAIIGDCGNNTVLSVDIRSGQSAKVLDLTATDYGDLMAGDVVRNGRLSSVAFDGKYVYVAMSAGYSSSIFAVDPASNRAVMQAWSPGDKPTAMQFVGGNLYVLDSQNSQLRLFDSALRLSTKAIDLQAPDPMGIVVRDNEVRVLTPADRSIRILKPDLKVLTAPQLAPIWKAKDLVIGPITALARDYALLICGDVAESGYDEFWNDTVWMYKTLLAAGYKENNIYVLYGWGHDYPSANPNYQHTSKVTDFPATVAWVNKILNGLKNGDPSIGVNKITSIDSLFVWVFDHGGGGNPAYFCLRDGVYYDSDFAGSLNSIPCKERAVFMQQCRSGGFVDNLQNDKNFISAACMWSENAHRADLEQETYNGVKYHHGEYNYYVISALSGKTITGAATNADSNGDGKISAVEMHAFMAARENQPEHPQMWDSYGVGGAFVVR